MALLAILNEESFNSLPDVLKAEYVKRDEGPFEGTYFLDVTNSTVKSADGKEAIFALEDVKGLKGTLQKVRGEVTDLTTKLKNFDGLDASSAREALKKLEDLSENPDVSEQHKAQLASVKKQLEEKHGLELKTVTSERDTLESQMSDILVDGNILKAFGKHKLVEGGSELLMPHVKNRIKVVKIDGKLVEQVLDEDGQPAISMRQGEQGLMSIDELVESFASKSTFKLAFQGTGASGSKNSKNDTKETRRNRSNDKNDDGAKDGIHRAQQDPAQALMDARANEK